MMAAGIFDRCFGECPLVAILRGVSPEEAVATGEAVFEAGIRIIEVPLNSPDPLASIKLLAERFGDEALVGAGTVLTADEVAAVREAGGRLVVSPNTNPAVIRASVAAGMVSCPGMFTPSEAFTALGSGAQALKLFPAEAASPPVVKAIRAVLPRHVRLLVVGGITPEVVGSWLDSGADGFGLGGALYSAGQSAGETLDKARAFVAAVRR